MDGPLDELEDGMDAKEILQLRKAFVHDIEAAVDQLHPDSSADDLRLAFHTLGALSMYAGRDDLQRRFSDAGTAVRAGRIPDLDGTREACQELETVFRSRAGQAGPHGREA